MKSLIIYGSHYGTTKRYAEKLAQMANIPIANYKDIKELIGYDLVIHFGGLYAGGVTGLKRTVKLLPQNAKFIIVTVGLADVDDENNTNNIKKALSKQVPEEILKSTLIFHLRGGIDYKELNLKHRMMMAFLYSRLKKLPEEKKTPEIKALIETYNSKVDFIDYASLNQIIKAIKQI